MSTNVLIEISGHGFGHLMQMMPVAAALQKRFPHFDICVRSGLAPERIRREVARFGRFRTHDDAAPDFHPRMTNAYSVDAAATIEACRGAFDAFDALVDDRRESASDVSADVAAIVARVKAEGDAALADYTARFDRF
ncbi:MAG TPA: histidinol dehydrogenase, partial [Rhodoblastus sp.]|nr:histidinol dehydrogenase [Rhodoblastus sp.]